MLQPFISGHLLDLQPLCGGDVKEYQDALHSDYIRTTRGWSIELLASCVGSPTNDLGTKKIVGRLLVF
jgi:hypothetical protein